MRTADAETRTGTKTENPVMEGILWGDLPPNLSIALIGAPGVGTSTMAVQFVVNSLRRGGKVFFVLFDYALELANKYFRSFGFDPEPFVTTGKLQIINGYDLLLRVIGISAITDIGKLRPVKFEEISKIFQTGLMDRLRDGEPEPSSLVVDSFTALSPFIDISLMYEILAEGFAAIREGKHPCLLVAHEGVLEGNFVQALTRFVDGVIWLKTEWSATGFTRELFIEKLRFTDVRTPSLDFTISNNGISLLPVRPHPRRGVSHDSLRSKVFQSQHSPSPNVDRTPTGISELDAVLTGGFPKGTFICIEGDIGTGTSTLCTQFAWSRLLASSKVSYYCIDERPETVIDQFHNYGWDIRPYIERKDIILSDAHSLFRTGRRESLKGAKQPDTTRALLGEFIRAEDAKMTANAAEGVPFVKVIDSFTTMAPYLDLKTAYVLARLFADDARKANATCLTVVRSGTVEANLLNACLGTADGIIRLQKYWVKGKHRSPSERKLIRRMRIEKMVFTPIPANALEYEISPTGIILSKLK